MTTYYVPAVMAAPVPVPSYYVSVPMNMARIEPFPQYVKPQQPQQVIQMRNEDPVFDKLKLKRKELLGQGGFGEVHKAVCMSTLREFAVKVQPTLKVS